MGLFSFLKKPAPDATVPPPAAGPSQRKDRPTPSRKEAEAARMARLHPELDPKKAKAINREAEASMRQKQLSAVDNLPERALMRDVIDSRFNVGEVALPLMMLILLVVLFPQLAWLSEASVFVMWGVVALIAADIFLMWTKFKRLAKERFPDRPIKGMLFYGWNRQMSFRRWRTPAPRVKRGETI